MSFNLENYSKRTIITFCFRDSSKNMLKIRSYEKPDLKMETTSSVTFVEGSGGLEKSKSDSKLNQVRAFSCMPSISVEKNLLIACFS